MRKNRIVLLTGRVPMFPARVARDIFAAADPLEATRDLLRESGLFDAAIALASPSLHESLKRWSRGGAAKKKRAPLKALAYALRMATRSTPFGLFAGTGVVQQGPASTLQLSSRAPELFVATDPAQTHAALAASESDRTLREDLPVVANDLLVLRGDRLHIRHPERLRRGLDTADPVILHYEPLNVRWSAQLEEILRIASIDRPLRDLRTALCDRLQMPPAAAEQLYKQAARYRVSDFYAAFRLRTARTSAASRN